MRPHSQASVKRTLPADGSDGEPREPVDGHRCVSDRQMAESCLAGDPLAWDAFFHACQPILLAGIRKLLGPKGPDVDLAEEIAARVWLALLKNRGELLQEFDAHRGTALVTFVASLARREVLQYLRMERRRLARERVAAADRKRAGTLTVSSLRAQLAEFARTLTPREREFLDFHLSGPPNGKPSPFTKTNAWQLSHRVRRKLEAFVNGQ